MIAEEMIKKEKPNLVITDMLMSGLDGRTLIRNLRENPNLKNLKIILMSAHPKALFQSQSCGADVLLAKPFDIEDLSEKVRMLLQ